MNRQVLLNSTDKICFHFFYFCNFRTNTTKKKNYNDKHKTNVSIIILLVHPFLRLLVPWLFRTTVTPCQYLINNWLFRFNRVKTRKSHNDRRYLVSVRKMKKEGKIESFNVCFNEMEKAVNFKSFHFYSLSYK